VNQPWKLLPVSGRSIHCRLSLRTIELKIQPTRNWTDLYVRNSVVFMKQDRLQTLPPITVRRHIHMLKRLLPASLLVLLGCSGEKQAATDAPKVVGFTLLWVHPKLPKMKPVRVGDASVAMRLGSVFEGYYIPVKGTPYDCPMYDVVVTLHGQDGSSTDLKVYLPRVDVFPGMWKHPSEVLFHFNPEKSQPSTLMEILTPYIPTNSVYTAEITTLPSIPYNTGIPDFREINWPITGRIVWGGKK